MFHSPYSPASKFSDSAADRLTPQTRHRCAHAAVSSPAAYVVVKILSVLGGAPLRPRFARERRAARAALCKVLRRTVQRRALRSPLSRVSPPPPPLRRRLSLRFRPPVSPTRATAVRGSGGRVPPAASSLRGGEHSTALRSVVERSASTPVGLSPRLSPCSIHSVGCISREASVVRAAAM
ncbi:unnamed protein product [Parnassius apollo]|uniref:(apollo) hypothetical protein n=1 Tax=Parnassius apollo TaxID=110799 RepID=A0A8S3WM84_PARAO|nr:unnamed protein product [Parnassius apollo]